MQRRIFLTKSMRLVCAGHAAVILAAGLPDRLLAQFTLTRFDAEQARSLTALMRCLFPHPALEDSYYIASVNQLDAISGKDAAIETRIKAGLIGLDKAATGQWLDLDADEKIAVLEAVEQVDFLSFMINQTINFLYGNKEVVATFGYQGSALEYGGYLHRGFDDIDWLPGETSGEASGETPGE